VKETQMIKHIFVLILVFAVLAMPALSQQKPQPPQPQQQAASNPTPQVSNPLEPPPVLSVPAGYKYESRGRRDPFVNPIPKPVEEEAAAPVVVRPPGLKGLLVADAKLLGVVTSREAAMNKVIIQAPGNKTYFASRGDTLWDGVIKDIQPDAVVFTVQSPARPNGPPPTSRDIVRKVRPATGDNK
jgi:hypothetical protein